METYELTTVLRPTQRRARVTACRISRRAPRLTNIGVGSVTAPPITPAKRAVQRAVLGSILRHPHDRSQLTVACLPSETCWDIDFFLGFARVERIIAIERDPQVAERIRAKRGANPRVEIFQGTTSEFLDTGRPVGLVYFDYCSALSAAVFVDVRLMLRRRVLRPGSKCVLTFLAAREMGGDQAAQRLAFEDLDARVPSGETWETMDPDRRRCVALNSFLAGFRATPVRPLPQGHPERLFATTTAPLWRRYYGQHGLAMLTCRFSLNTYGRRGGVEAVGKATDAWYVRGTWGLRDISRRSLSGIARTEGRAVAEAFYEREIMAFYREHGYAPTSKEIGRANVRGWTALLRRLGLCPRQNATTEDVKREIRRIFEREGDVQWSHIRRARLSRKCGLYPAALRRLCVEMGIAGAIQTRQRRKQRDQDMARLRAFLTALESGVARTSAPGYRWAVRFGCGTYEGALKGLRLLEQDEDATLRRRARTARQAPAVTP